MYERSTTAILEYCWLLFKIDQRYILMQVMFLSLWCNRFHLAALEQQYVAESLHAVQKIQGTRSSGKVYHPTTISAITTACASLSSSNDSTASSSTTDQVVFNPMMTVASHRKGQKQANIIEPTGSRSDRGSTFHKWYGIVQYGTDCSWYCCKLVSFAKDFALCVAFLVPYSA